MKFKISSLEHFICALIYSMLLSTVVLVVESAGFAAFNIPNNAMVNVIMYFISTILMTISILVIHKEEDK